MKKKILIITSVLLLLSISVFLIWFGINNDKSSNPKLIYSKVIDNISNEIINKIDENDQYNFGDKFSIEGKVDFDLSSEYYTNKSKTDEEFKKKNNILKNLSNMDIDYKIKQDANKGNIYLELNEKIDKESIISAKFLIDNFTKYYFVDGIVKNYINDGGSNYFETINEENETKDNIDYLYNTIIESLKNNLKDEYFSAYSTEEEIEDERKSVYSITLTLDNKTIRNILNGILQDLKNDEKSNTIISSFYSDFKDTKIDEEKNYLEKDEKIIFYIYVDKLFYKPLKYKIEDKKENDKNVFTYEDGTFYYIENTIIKYNGNITFKNNEINISVRDKKNNDVGTIKYEKDVSNTTLSISLALENNSYNIEYSSKYIDYVKNKSYTNEKTVKFKITDGLVNKMVGSAKITMNKTKEVVIEEDISESKLKSSLAEEQNNKINNLKTTIRERLEK